MLWPARVNGVDFDLWRMDDSPLKMLALLQACRKGGQRPRHPKRMAVPAGLGRVAGKNPDLDRSGTTSVIETPFERSALRHPPGCADAPHVDFLSHTVW